MGESRDVIANRRSRKFMSLPPLGELRYRYCWFSRDSHENFALYNSLTYLLT